MYNKFLLERSRKGESKAMLELSKCTDGAIANMWLFRAVLYGNEEARTILRKDPSRVENMLFPIENFILESRALWFSGTYTAEDLKEAGFDKLPDPNGSYTVAGLSEERVLVIGHITGGESPDEDGFGMEIDYDYYAYDEFFNGIFTARCIENPRVAYGKGEQYVKANNKELPKLHYDWLIEDGILNPEDNYCLRALYNNNC